MKRNDIPPAFMPASEHCDMGCETPIGGVVVVDTVICAWHCTEQCREYFDFDDAQVSERKRLRKTRDTSDTVIERPELEL